MYKDYRRRVLQSEFLNFMSCFSFHERFILAINSINFGKAMRRPSLPFTLCSKEGANKFLI